MKEHNEKWAKAIDLVLKQSLEKATNSYERGERGKSPTYTLKITQYK